MNWFQRNIMRKVLSKLAIYTPGVVYYPRSLRIRLVEGAKEIEMSEEGSASVIGQSVIFMATALTDLRVLDKDEVAKFTLTSVEYDGKDYGTFEMTIRKKEDDDACMG